MKITFDSIAELVRWLRVTTAPLGRTGMFWTQLAAGRFKAGSAAPGVRVDVVWPCEGAEAGARRWHNKTKHPTTKTRRRAFEHNGGGLDAPELYPAEGLSTPFGACPHDPPEAILGHPLARRIQRNLPGIVPELRHAPGRYTFIWVGVEGERVRLQLDSDLLPGAAGCSAAGAPRPPSREAEDALGGRVGEACRVVFSGKACADDQAATYRLVEAVRLIPSHDAQTFRPRPDYPADVQERRYHSDKSEQQKVLDNSAPGCFQPALLCNTDPTALGGTPLVTPEGWVLGGNSRTMVLQRIYAAGGPAAEAYRHHLATRLHTFGLSPDAAEGLSAPVVVRVVEPASKSPRVLGELVRRYNEGLTQALERTAEQVAVSARLSEPILAELQKVEDETLHAFLASGKSRPLVRQLVEAEVIPKAQTGRLLAPTGLLSEEGRGHLTRALLGRALPHPDLIDLLTEGLKDALARATPYLLNAATVHADAAERARWDVRALLPAAVRIWSRARAAGLKDAAELADQRELTGEGLDLLTTATLLLANVLLQRSGPRQLPDAVRAFAEASAFTTTPTLFGTHEAPVVALARAARLELPQGPGIVAVEDFRPLPDPLPLPAPPAPQEPVPGPPTPEVTPRPGEASEAPSGPPEPPPARVAYGALRWALASSAPTFELLRLHPGEKPERGLVASWHTEYGEEAQLFRLDQGELRAVAPSKKERSAFSRTTQWVWKNPRSGVYVWYRFPDRLYDFESGVVFRVGAQGVDADSVRYSRNRDRGQLLQDALAMEPPAKPRRPRRAPPAEADSPPK